LTVDGTVNATGHGDHGEGWVEGSLRMGDGEAVINGSGTIYLKSKGRILNIGSDKARRELTLDGVTLVGLPDNDSSLVGVSEGGGLVLKSGAITGNTHSSEGWTGGGGVAVHRGGTFTMEGGAITGNSASGKDGSSGGGVRIGEEAVFTMKGGEITGNTAREGGGVHVYTKGTFTMSGGEITGNTAWEGGGVHVWQGMFTMSGDRIQGGTDSDGFAANTITGSGQSAALWVGGGAATKWGTGGTYTKGGVPQTGGADIVQLEAGFGGTNDTLIAVPGK
jgi:hypothetical protein